MSDAFKLCPLTMQLCEKAKTGRVPVTIKGGKAEMICSVVALKIIDMDKCPKGLPARDTGTGKEE